MHLKCADARRVWSAIQSIAPKIGCTAVTSRRYPAQRREQDGAIGG
jgi:hypothetical protein